MALEAFFKPDTRDEMHVYNPTEAGKSTAILDFLRLAFIAYCDEEDRGAKIYVVQKKIIKAHEGQLYFPPKLDLEEHIDEEVGIGGVYKKPVFHRKAGKGVLTVAHKHPYISLN